MNAPLKVTRDPSTLSHAEWIRLAKVRFPRLLRGRPLHPKYCPLARTFGELGMVSLWAAAKKDDVFLGETLRHIKALPAPASQEGECQIRHLMWSLRFAVESRKPPARH